MKFEYFGSFILHSPPAAAAFALVVEARVRFKKSLADEVD